MKNIYIGICLSTYRLDFCNYIHLRYGCEIYHLSEEAASGASLELLKSQAVFPEKIFKGGKSAGITGFRDLWRLMKRQRPSFVITPEFSPLTLCAVIVKHMLGLNCNVVSMCDDSIDMIEGNDFTLAHRLSRSVVPRLVDNVWSSDPMATQWYRDKFGKGVYFPIIADEEVFRSALSGAMPISKRIMAEFCNDGRKTILFVGRLVGLKNVGTLIEAYSKLPKDQLRLVIVGDGEEREKLEALDRELGTEAIFTGSLNGDELIAWYNVADVFVLPSIREPFGAVVNEALMAGCQCVVSERCGSSTLIESGKNGELFDPGDVDSLAEKMSIVVRRVERSSGETLRENLMPIRFKQSLNEAIALILPEDRKC